MGVRILLLFAGVLAVVAPAAHSSAAGDRAGQGMVAADPVVAEWPDWPYRAACRGISFDPNRVFAEVPDAGLGAGPLDRALRHAVRLFSTTAPRRGWRLARRAHGRAGFVHGHPGAELESGNELQYVELRRRGGRWRAEGYDQKCWLWTMRAGRSADTWFLAPGQPPLGPGTRRIRVISGAHCSSKERRPAIVGRPRFDRFGDRLTMTLWLRHRGGGANEVCDPRLRHFPPFEIELPHRLGQLRLFDGGEYPPQPATVWEEPRAIGL